MPENLFETQYDVTKRSRFKQFYESNKIIIYSIISILVISLAATTFYYENKSKKKILLSENYIKAKIYLNNENKKEALEILKTNVFENDATYSPLSLFLIMDQNLIPNYKEVSDLFDHILTNNNFLPEVRDLLIYKKALHDSNYVNELELIESTRPLLSDKSFWKPHALLLLGDYFFSKREYVKSIEFYQEIFSIKNLSQDIYNHAKSQLVLAAND